jgi:hypothetical protein
LIAKGIDPALVEAEAREKADRERALRIKHSFAAVAEDFIADKLAQERSGKLAERDLRSTFIAAWAERPVIEISKFDVLEIINAKKRTAPQMARSLLIMIKRFFNWVIDQHVYGLTTSPCDRLSRAKIIGEPHQNVLADLVFAEAGWDGNEAAPIDSVAVRTAAEFIRAMPNDLPLPEFAPEPDGSISLDWIQSRNRLFSLSVGSTNRLAYAWLDGSDKGHGVARFDGERIPSRIIEGIIGIMKHGNATIGS